MEGIADYLESVDQLANSKSRAVEGGFHGATPRDSHRKFSDMTPSQDIALVARLQQRVSCLMSLPQSTHMHVWLRIPLQA